MVADRPLMPWTLRYLGLVASASEASPPCLVIRYRPPGFQSGKYKLGAAFVEIRQGDVVIDLPKHGLVNQRGRTMIASVRPGDPVAVSIRSASGARTLYEGEFVLKPEDTVGLLLVDRTFHKPGSCSAVVEVGTL